MGQKQIALVTGGSRGIGKAIALALGKRGFYVIVNYNGNDVLAKQVVTQIQTAGGEAEKYQCNIGDCSAVDTMIQNIVKCHGSIDVLVNNAGITRDSLVLRMTEQDFDEVINTNLKGMYNTIKPVSRYMLKQKQGRIINISSVSAIMGNAGQANYCAAKAGVIGLTKCVARELASRNITVNAVAPGFIDTDMTKQLSTNVLEQIIQSIPLKRYGKPEDVADVVTFLATNPGNYITGQVFQVDGGLAM